MKENTISQDTILKVAKEISVKFIEIGRITPASFDTSFKTIYRTIEETVEKKDGERK